MENLGRILAAMAIACLAASQSTASTFVAASLDDLVRESEVVVEGHVVGLASRWSADRTHIDTEIVLRVSDVLLGTVEDEISVVVPGGRVGDFVVEVAGAPSFRPGDHVVVLLARHSESLSPGFRVVGYERGLFVISTSPEGDTTVSKRLSPGVTYIGSSDSPGNDSLMSLPELKERIRDSAAYTDSEERRP